MDKLKVLLQKLGIELTADQTKQITEVIEKEFVPAADVAANKTKLDELTKQLAARDKDLAKLKADNKSEELQKQLDELNAKYKQDTDDLNANCPRSRRISPQRSCSAATSSQVTASASPFWTNSRARASSWRTASSSAARSTSRG